MKIFIRTNNDAFQPDPAPEVVRILRELADRLEAQGLDTFQAIDVWSLYDVNGNKCGTVRA